ncbi:MAG TPA: hypothetical protein VF897_04090, partial [Roseiflexaceae bacterium]
WAVGRTRVEYGASLGAGAIILPDVTIGRFALVGAGAVVAKDVPAHALVLGNPARLVGFVCRCGRRLRERERRAGLRVMDCPACESRYELEAPDGSNH